MNRFYRMLSALLVATLLACHPIRTSAHPDSVHIEFYELGLVRNSERHYFPTGKRVADYPIATVNFGEVNCPGWGFNHSRTFNVENHEGEWYVIILLGDDECDAAYVSVLLFDRDAASASSSWTYQARSGATRMWLLD